MTVQALMYRLVQRIDPYMKDGTEILESDGTYGVGRVDGSRFTKQRQLDIYNDARKALLGWLRSTMPIDAVCREVGGTVQQSQLTFSAANARREATLPTDYLDFVSLRGRYLDGVVISTATEPIIRLPQSFVPIVTGADGYFAESATVRFVFEENGKLVHYGGHLTWLNAAGTTQVSIGDLTKLVGSFSAYISNLNVGAKISLGGYERTIASITDADEAYVTVAFPGAISYTTLYVQDYRLAYLGLTEWTLANVYGGTSTETIDQKHHVLLMEIGEALANEVGAQELNALLTKYVGGK